jgi:cephalosporin hydroxylase
VVRRSGGVGRVDGSSTGAIAPKAWDGYLVLLCTSFAPDPAAISQIERDTTRIRKIVATADMLKTTSELARILDVFMPLAVPESATVLHDVLDTLPNLMREHVDPSAVRAVVDAFRTMEPPLERLHSLGKAR